MFPRNSKKITNVYKSYLLTNKPMMADFYSLEPENLLINFSFSIEDHVTWLRIVLVI